MICCCSGPVLSLVVTSSGEQCFSGGIDSTIQWWNIPSSNVDPYDTYGEKIKSVWLSHLILIELENKQEFKRRKPA